MRIAITLYSLDGGGAEFQMALLAGGLHKRGHEVEFWLMASSENERWASRWCRPLIRRARLLPGRLAYAGILGSWRRALKRFRPHAVIGGLPLPHTLVSLAATGLDIPVIGRRCASWGDLTVFPQHARMPRKLRAMRRLAARGTAAMVCNAQHVLASARDLEGWPREKLRLIRNGWPESPAIDHENRLVATAGRGRIEKDHEAHRRIMSGLPRLDGQPGTRQEHVFHYEADVPWHNMGIYAHVSRSEGCSNAIGMAMAHGIPVVAYGTLGNLELLRDLPTVWPYEESLFRDRIHVLQSSRELREILGVRGQELVRKRFGLDRMVEEWESLIDETATPRCPTCGQRP